MKRLLALVLILFIAGCGGVEKDAKENNLDDENKESVIFRQIDIVSDNEKIEITGEVKSWDGRFYYHILQGEEMVSQEEKVVTEHAGVWTSFVIQLDHTELAFSEDVPHLVLYSKNKNDEQINPNYVPIDLE